MLVEGLLIVGCIIAAVIISIKLFGGNNGSTGGSSAGDATPYRTGVPTGGMSSSTPPRPVTPGTPVAPGTPGSIGMAGSITPPPPKAKEEKKPEEKEQLQEVSIYLYHDQGWVRRCAWCDGENDTKAANCCVCGHQLR